MATVDINDHSDDYKQQVGMSIKQALTAIGIHIEGEAKEELENTPRRIDTGNLRNSINYQVKTEEDAVYIGTNVSYARYVHEGTVNMAANRFLTNAVDRNRDQINGLLKDALG